MRYLKPFSPLSPFSDRHVKRFLPKRIALKVDVLQDRKIYCLQARPCIFQSRNFTGWSSEGVKMGSDESRFMLHSLRGAKPQDSVHKPQLF